MDLNDLSKEDLIKIISDLKNQIEALTKPKPNDWHSWFYSLLLIEFHDYPSVKVDREVVLGSQPPRADFVVVKEEDIVDLGLGIFRDFRKQNIIEFKSPDDELTESVLWKALGYADFYVSLNDIPAEDITITIFRGARPNALFKRLEGNIEKTDINGVYKLKNWRGSFPIQFVVTTELEGEEYAGFRAISKKPDLSDIEQIMLKVKSEKDERVRGWYRDYLDLFSRLDSEMLEEAKRRDPDMAKDYREIFGFDKELQDERNAEQRERIEIMLRDGKSAEAIADFCKYPISLVKEVEQNMLVTN